MSIDELIRQAERLGPGALPGEPELMGAWVKNLERAGALRIGLPVDLAENITGAIDSASYYHGTPPSDAAEWIWGDWTNGSYAEEDFSAIGRRIEDGRWITVSGGCDTTGWDCQSGAWVTEHDDIAQAIAALTQEGRVAILAHLTRPESQGT